MMNGITIRRVYFNLSQLVSCLVIVQALLNITQGAPLKDGFHPIIAEKQQALEAISQPKVSNLAHVSSINDNSPTILNSKIKRDTNNAVKDAVKEGSSSSDHLDTQETGYLHNPAPYHTSDSDYGYDSGKNAYGKQASDWSQYDQGNHGLYDKYGDKAWNEQGHNGQSNHGKHDSYGNSYNSQNSGHGSGYYSRDRGYGYEKHYAYDKEVASKQHADNHNAYGSNHGLHDYYGNSASHSHGNQGHDRYGQLSRYGNHGYGKKGSNLAAHHDYGHNNNKAHYYTNSASPSYPHQPYPNYHVPTYRSSYTDYSPQIGYPSSYPSYY